MGIAKYESITQTMPYFIGASHGSIPGVSVIHKFGRNTAVPNGSWEGVLEAGAQFYFPTTATTVRIKAGGNVFLIQRPVIAEFIHK